MTAAELARIRDLAARIRAFPGNPRVRELTAPWAVTMLEADRDAVCEALTALADEVGAAERRGWRRGMLRAATVSEWCDIAAYAEIRAEAGAEVCWAYRYDNGPSGYDDPANTPGADHRCGLAPGHPGPHSDSFGFGWEDA